MKKTCYKCKKKKDISLFYKHKGMLDGHLNKCKACIKKYIKDRYYSEDGNKRIKEYEKKRNINPARKLRQLEYQRKRRALFKGKEKARKLVQKLTKAGILEREPCIVCGNPKTEAHHKDYRKPADVEWLCFKHHREIHKLKP